MEIHEQRLGAVTVLKPAGALAGPDAEAFRARADGVRAASLGRFVVDASGIPFVDSAGLEALLGLAEQMGRGGQSLRICAATETLREVLELTGLAPQFEHFENPADAARSFL